MSGSKCISLLALLVGATLGLSACGRWQERRFRIELPVNYCGTVTLVDDPTAPPWVPEKGVYVLRVTQGGFTTASFSNLKKVWFNVWQEIDVVDASGAQPPQLSPNDPPSARGIAIGSATIEGNLCP